MPAVTAPPTPSRAETSEPLASATVAAISSEATAPAPSAPAAPAAPEPISCRSNMPEQSCTMDCASEHFQCAWPCAEKCQKCDTVCDASYDACHAKCPIDNATLNPETTCAAKCSRAKEACSAPCYRAKERCLTGDCGKKMAACEKRDAAERKAKFYCRGSVENAVTMYLTCKSACTGPEPACRDNCEKSTRTKTGCSGSFYAKADWGFSVVELHAIDGVDAGAP